MLELSARHRIRWFFGERAIRVSTENDEHNDWQNHILKYWINMQLVFAHYACGIELYAKFSMQPKADMVPKECGFNQSETAS